MDVFTLIGAAGSFQRMGENKLLLSIEDTNVIKRVLLIFSHEKIKGIVWCIKMKKGRKSLEIILTCVRGGRGRRTLGIGYGRTTSDP